MRCANNPWKLHSLIIIMIEIITLLIQIMVIMAIIIMVTGNLPICWGSLKKSIVATSTIEAE